MSGVRPGPHRQDLWVGLHGTNQVGLPAVFYTGGFVCIILDRLLCLHGARQATLLASIHDDKTNQQV
jgi:hypothetical protein